ncbi:MAG: amylo-alpha-1,6-glucosidase [Planctomycetota bacterium]
MPETPVYRCHTAQAHPDPLWTEWLLTNRLGGYAMGTVSGTPTRRYHGLLVAALRPPVERTVALSSIIDRVQLRVGTDEFREITLTPLHFNGADTRAIVPDVHAAFERDDRVTWRFDIDDESGPIFVEKSVELIEGRNAVRVGYVVNAHQPARLVMRPLVALRDFHSLRREDRSGPRFFTRVLDPSVSHPGVLCATRSVGVYLMGEASEWHDHPEHWRNIEYAWEDRRGVDSTEHLFSPGAFVADREPGDKTPAAVFASIDAMDPPDAPKVRAARRERLMSLAQATIERAGNMSGSLAEEDEAALTRLTLAADDFVVQRGPAQDNMSTIIAGYPWFSDWGRDTMIALPGLLLATGRHDEALKALQVFARNRRRGLIPNRFDDYSGPAHFNTVDAPLWFLHAAAEYLRVTGDNDGYAGELAAAALDIIEAFGRGTDFDIRVDAFDGLVTAGSPDTQLTWMDAQRDGVTFTPRHGKAVEINALWHHGLLATADAVEASGAKCDPTTLKDLRFQAERCRVSFNERFGEAGSGLADRLEFVQQEGAPATWAAIDEIRPNQIFAASLRHGPLDNAGRAKVVASVREHLLTPHGLRTLAPGSEGYVGRLEGDMFARDKAYHNGTTWPWLIGAYAEAVMRADDFSDASRAEARAALKTLIDSLSDASAGQLAEIFDGDHEVDRPQRPDGCPAQAWSVAETLRAFAMVVRGAE